MKKSQPPLLEFNSLKESPSHMRKSLHIIIHIIIHEDRISIPPDKNLDLPTWKKFNHLENIPSPPKKSQPFPNTSDPLQK